MDPHSTTLKVREGDPATGQPSRTITRLESARPSSRRTSARAGPARLVWSRHEVPGLLATAPVGHGSRGRLGWYRTDSSVTQNPKIIL
jgi:hypothetical protein